MMKRFLFLAVYLLLALSSTAQQANVVAELDSVAVFIGQPTHLTLAVTSKEGSEIVLPDFQPRHYLIPEVEILEVAPTDTIHLDNTQMKLSQRLTLTAFEDSLYAIPPIGVVVNGDTLFSRTIALKVMTVDVDTLHLDQFFPPKSVQNNPFQWSEWRGLFWLSLLMLLLCLSGFYLSVRLKENKPVISRIRIIKKILPHQRALKEIDKLKEEKMSTSEDQKAYYTRLTDTLRRYIEERFGFSAMEMTSSEIIYHLQASGDQTMIAELKELFETADLVKFAKYSTLINENDLNLVNAVQFIDQTKLEGMPTEERIVPTLSESDVKTRQNRRVIKVMLGLIVVAVVVILAYILYQLAMLFM